MAKLSSGQGVGGGGRAGLQDLNNSSAHTGPEARAPFKPMEPQRPREAVRLGVAQFHMQRDSGRSRVEAWRGGHLPGAWASHQAPGDLRTGPSPLGRFPSGGEVVWDPASISIGLVCKEAAAEGMV